VRPTRFCRVYEKETDPPFRRFLSPGWKVIEQYPRTTQGVIEMLDFVKRNRVWLDPGVSATDLIDDGHRDCASLSSTLPQTLQTLLAQSKG
jgi:hypothetical protein